MTSNEFDAMILANIPFADFMGDTTDHVGWLSANYASTGPGRYISTYYYPPTTPLVAIAEVNLHLVGECLWATYRVGRPRFGDVEQAPDFSSSDDPVRDTLAWVAMIARTTAETDNDH